MKALLILSNYFQHDDLEQRCVSYIKTRLTIKNMFDGCLTTQKDFNVLYYISIFMEYIGKNFSSLSQLKCKFYVELHVSVIRKILSSSELFVISEKEVFMAVHRLGYL